METTLELIATRGIPASGKTTWAKAWVAEAPAVRARLNRDDLRASLFGAQGAAYQAYFTADRETLYRREQAVTAVEEAGAERLLRAGISVVADATNIRRGYLKRWQALAEKNGADFRVELFDTALDECLRRDRARDWPVGDAVVREMHSRLRSALRAGELEEKVEALFPPRQYDPGRDSPDAVARAWIVDVDGTLALMNGRGPYDTSRYHEDLPCGPVVAVVDALSDAGYEIVVMSGRDEEFRPQTEAWLRDHAIPWDALVMRPAGDRRNDSEVKAELFWEHVAPRWHVEGSIDDRDRVVEMWRSIGLRCLQAAPGDF